MRIQLKYPTQMRKFHWTDNEGPNFLKVSMILTDQPSWLQILACYGRTPKDPLHHRNNVGRKAMKATNRMVRLVEDLLAAGCIQYCPFHIIPALFAAMMTLTTEIEVGEKMSQKLAKAKLKTCLIALRELQSTWPISGWIESHFVDHVTDLRIDGNM